MIILCTHNSGGVGKTTLAVHVAGILASQSTGGTLLIDCDDQSDSWWFYANRKPKFSQEVLVVGESLSVIENHKRHKIRTLVNMEEYDNIVLDIDTPLKNTVQTIVQNAPDMVLVPISKPHEDKGLMHLPGILNVMATLQTKGGFSPKVIIVPLGIAQDNVLNQLEKVPVKPQFCRVASAIRNLQDQMSHAIFKQRQYIWDYDEQCQDLYDYFCVLLGVNK